MSTQHVIKCKERPEAALEPGSLQPVEYLPSADVGEALDAAREQDRAWRAARAAAMQSRLHATVGLEELGHRIRRWSFRLMWGGLGLFVVSLIVGILLMNAELPDGRFRDAFVGLMIVTSLAAAVGLIMLPASKLLRAASPVWRNRLRRQAARDYLDLDA